MKIVRHRNIVRLHEVLASRTKIYIILEFVTGGELFDMIVRASFILYYTPHITKPPVLLISSSNYYYLILCCVFRFIEGSFLNQNPEDIFNSSLMLLTIATPKVFTTETSRFVMILCLFHRLKSI